MAAKQSALTMRHTQISEPSQALARVRRWRTRARACSVGTDSSMTHLTSKPISARAISTSMVPFVVFLGNQDEHANPQRK